MPDVAGHNNHLKTTIVNRSFTVFEFVLCALSLLLD
jgi:hypothetical protein